ncbi:MAG: alpha/beta fold hydrolase [Gammaproteobacteria bacterium]|nr:alpha/beta fold hydrolase [Gammaproteobacteria bacterium]
MKMWKPLSRTLLLVVLILFPLYLFGYIPILDSRYQPSASPAYLPAAGVSFVDYMEQNRSRIREALSSHYYSKTDWPFGADYPIETVVQMRAPFELAPVSDSCEQEPDAARKGFLLIHGLTDSPYLLSDLASSLNQQYPCSYVRGVLVPGHGTVPGDLMNVELSDWRQIVQYGVTGLESLVDQLYLIGYSSGSTLALDYLQENPQNASISGLILLSPGLAAAQSGIAMAPWLKYLVRWVGRGADTDAAKYDSMPMHAAALFYEVTAKVRRAQTNELNRPVFMVVSGDDTTVDTSYAAEFFCTAVSSSQRQLIWYRSLETGSSPPVSCSGLEIVDVAVPDARFVSHSHVAISMPPENEHYGLDGNYSVCTSYLDNPAEYSGCVDDDINTLYGENTLRDENRRFQGKLVRRATFNPFYQEMLASMVCFIDGDCSN